MMMTMMIMIMMMMTMMMMIDDDDDDDDDVLYLPSNSGSILPIRQAQKQTAKTCPRIMSVCTAIGQKRMLVQTACCNNRVTHKLNFIRWI
jgi:hypothetical protein